VHHTTGLHAGARLPCRSVLRCRCAGARGPPGLLTRDRLVVVILLVAAARLTAQAAHHRGSKSDEVGATGLLQHLQ
jgi:hypothetical protein